MPVHYLSEIRKDEGVYRARLYSRLKWWRCDSTGYRSPHRLTTDMRHHIDNISNWDAPVEIAGDLVKESGVGAIASKLDNELEQGTITKDNFSLTLEPDPVLHDLIDTIRDRDQEIWLELTLEQTPDAPILHGPNKIIWESRKTRCLYWGRLIRNEAKGKVERQKFPHPLVKDADAELHLGEMTFSFQTWFNIVCGLPGEKFLSDYQTLYPVGTDWTLPISDLFYQLFTWISPVNLNGFADDRLHTESDYPILPDTGKNIDRCNFRTHYKLVDQTFTHEAGELWLMRFERSKAGVDRPLFNKDSDVSLYKKWTTIGDAAKTLARDFRFKFQYELPTLSDYRQYMHSALLGIAASAFGNDARDRTQYWKAAMRWLFTEAKYMPLALDLGTCSNIEYTPSAVFTNKISIKETDYKYKLGGAFYNADGKQDGQAGVNEWVTSPDFVNDEAGQEISWETLFRLTDVISVIDMGTPGFPTSGKVIDGGNSLLIYDEATDTLIEPHGVNGFNDDDPAQIALDWSGFHYFKEHQEWWAPRALLEFEMDGVGIMRFPTVRDFDLMEWGEFPHFRKITASPGILYNKKNGQPILGTFSVFDISQQPGGNTKLRAIEIASGVSVTLDYEEPPPATPPERHIDTPPTFAGSPMCGTDTIIFCVVAPAQCVDHADITLDGAAWGTVNQFPNPMPTNCIPVQIVVNTANLANGLHVFCVTVHFCDGTSIGPVCWNFIVFNPCGVGTTTQKIWKP